jgi:hypothetical protein
MVSAMEEWAMGHRWINSERGKADELGEKPVPMTLCVPQIPLLPTWCWTLASTLGCSLHNRLLIFILLRNVIQTANNITNGVFPDISRRQWHYPGGLCFQTSHTVSWYIPKCIFTNANKESRGFPAPFVVRFTSAVCADVTEFHPNSTVSAGSKAGIPFTPPPSKVCVSPHRFSQSPVISVFSASDKCYPNRMQKCVKLGKIWYLYSSGMLDSVDW